MTHQPSSVSDRSLSNRLDAWGIRQAAPRTVGPGATLPTEEFLRLVQRRRLGRLATTAGVCAAAACLLALLAWFIFAPDEQPSNPVSPQPPITAPTSGTDIDNDITGTSSSSGSATPGRNYLDAPTFGAMHRILTNAPDPTALSVPLPPTSPAHP